MVRVLTVDFSIRDSRGFRGFKSRIRSTFARSALLPDILPHRLTPLISGAPCSSGLPSYSPPSSLLQYGLSSTWLSVPLVLTGYVAHVAFSSSLNAPAEPPNCFFFVCVAEQKLIRPGPMHRWFHIRCLVPRPQ